jgi:predicted GNAT family N-acyltransferase
MMPDFSVQQTEFHETPGIKTVREQVFIQEQHVPEELEWDGHDARAIHIVAYDAHDQVIGTARLLADGHIGRMAVLESWRKHGVGSAMLTKLLMRAQQHNLSKVFLHAQISAIGFYERHGFITLGEEFMDAGIPHRHMEKDLG